MLPKPEYFPIRGSETTEIPLVAFPVSTQLDSPKIGQFVFPRWQTPAMPEVSIDEYRQSFCREYDIGRTRQFPIILAESKASSSKLLLNDQFQRAILELDALHGT
jgi:hypothetical protein